MSGIERDHHVPPAQVFPDQQYRSLVCYSDALYIQSCLSTF